MRRFLQLAVLLLCTVPLMAQSASGSISGSIHDAQGGAIPNAKVSLTNEAQGVVVRDVTTNTEGTFVFTPLNPGAYTVTIEASGFKQFKQSGISLSSNDRIGLPAIQLEVGAVGESVQVEATAIQLETVSAERSGLITGRQIVDIALNGRNFSGMMKTIPGASADCGGGGLGCTFNGQRTDQNNYTVDGQTVTDVGVNAQFAYRVNVDSIQEVKVSTNSQAAEFGRNSGAQVQVVTKGGTNQFHGNAWWFKRGEFMNANDFINNYSGRQRALYRHTQVGYTFGGPVFIPGKFNTNKDKLFFFLSHEFQRSLTPNAQRQITVPTALERQGNFSQTRDAAGNPVIIRDPLNGGQQFPGNIIPTNRFNQYGPSTLNWLPLPNISGQLAYNYQSQIPNEDPYFDQVYRVDYNISDKWRMFVRALHDSQTQIRPYGRADTGNNLGLEPFRAPTFGKGITANLTTIINPTLTNEFQFGYAVNGIPGDGPSATSAYLRSVSNINIPLLYPEANANSGVIPNFNFGGTPTVSGTAMTSFQGTPYANRNPVWNFTDNVAKVSGNHTFKFGVFFEYAVKTENAFRPYNGTIDFGRDSTNPGDTNWAFSNALLGNFRTYTQINKNPLPSYPYNNLEMFAQDTWKVTRKLTLNYGLRVSFIRPFYDKDNLMANFNYDKFTTAQTVRLYQPGPNNTSINPITGASGPGVLVGAIVPGVGNLNNGMVVSGQDGTPRGLIDNRGAHWGPRFGLAYQINDKTVLRTGGGVFFERIATFGPGITSNYTTNPPTLRQAQIFNGNLSTIQGAGETFFPATITRLSPDGHVPTVYNYNLGIQRQLPAQVFFDISYVGSQSRHLWLAQPFNNVPFGSAWQPYSQNPNVTPRFDGTTNVAPNFYRPLMGYTNGNDFTWGASANYNAMQIAINRRRGPLQFGVAYTWSKALGVIQGHLTDARANNYGPLALDRTQSLTLNYTYSIPGLARNGFLDNRAAKMVLNGWQLSGLTSMSVGAPINVTYSQQFAAGGAQVTGGELNRRITGSEDVAPRPVLTCSPNLSRGDRSLLAFINTSCFASAAVGSVGGDSGLNRLRGPGVHQWDMNLFKNIDIKEGMRIQLRMEAYNAFNTPQWGGINSTAAFNQAGQITNLATPANRFGFGSLNAIRANSARIVQIAAKFSF
jgi:hypothetical protein